jgi:hypothetical protein
MGRRAGSSGGPRKVTDHPIWIDNGHMGRERRTAPRVRVRTSGSELAPGRGGFVDMRALRPGDVIRKAEGSVILSRGG